MDVVVSFFGEGSADELEAFNSWLRGDPDYDGRVKLVTAPPHPGELGVNPEAIAITVSSSSAITILASALKGYTGRLRGAKMHVTLREKRRLVDVRVENLTSAEAAELVRSIMDADEDDGSGARR